jgi:hypothetical protein
MLRLKLAHNPNFIANVTLLRPDPGARIREGMHADKLAALLPWRRYARTQVNVRELISGGLARR